MELEKMHDFDSRELHEPLITLLSYIRKMVHDVSGTKQFSISFMHALGEASE